MKEYKIKFSFKVNSEEWYWIKTFHTDNIDKSIIGYLETKELPFELIIKDIKWKKLN
jgi:hypothetical protein